MNKKSLIMYSAILSFGGSVLAFAPTASAFNPMNPGSWFGGNKHDDDYYDDYYYDRYYGGPYGYGPYGGWGGPYGYGGGPYGYGYGYPGYGNQQQQSNEPPPPPLPQ